VSRVSHGRADLLDVRAETSHASRRFRLIGRLAIWAAVAAPFAIASFVIIFVSRIGPVVLVISQRYGRGVHLGDLLIGVPFGLVAVGAGLTALSTYHRGHHLVTR
jgi:hypothetical protein